MIWELPVVLSACTSFLSFGTEYLELVCGLPYPPLLFLFCLHSVRCLYVGLGVYLHFSSHSEAWSLKFFSRIQNYIRCKNIYTLVVVPSVSVLVEFSKSSC